MRTANRGDLLPSYAGWLLLGWIALCVFLIGPASGFSFALAPALLLVAADARARTSRSGVPVGAQLRR